jgi:hypothetical protein
VQVGGEIAFAHPTRDALGRQGEDDVLHVGSKKEAQTDAGHDGEIAIDGAGECRGVGTDAGIDLTLEIAEVVDQSAERDLSS